MAPLARYPRLVTSLVTAALALATGLLGADAQMRRRGVAATYLKVEHAVPMRDGVRLHTAVYAPRTCPPGGHPIMLQRTPYGVAPYGADAYRRSLGPSRLFEEDGFIFAYQDVRGRYMSEGVWEEVRPYRPPHERGPQDTNEATDAYDTIEWLTSHVPCNNGRVGVWGISYPGFYASSAMIEAHPALRAVSPQGPVTDYYLNDDSYHHGAFLLAHNFGFYVNFAPRGPRPTLPADERAFDFGTTDAYAFYLSLGSLEDATRRHGLADNPYWMMNLEHTTYDAFWKARSVWRHFEGVRPAVLTVGGWYDAENLWGALRTHAAVRDQSPATRNHLVMGPWTHGSWALGEGRTVGRIALGSATARHYREDVEFPFFVGLLKDRKVDPPAAATIFDTGALRWRTFDTWPPRTTATRTWFLGTGGVLTNAPAGADSTTAWVSDPLRPVPVVEQSAEGMPSDYMTGDQRFAASRDDVVVFVSEPLDADVTVVGAVNVDLHMSTTGTDADIVVKLIDVHPVEGGSGEDGRQLLVRGEPFRGKFREGFETPVPFVPGEPARVAFSLGDVAHTFRKGHRVMVHVQGSWFPLVDRNPQTFTHIPGARAGQFVRATHRVHHGPAYRSSVTVSVLP